MRYYVWFSQIWSELIDSVSYSLYSKKTSSAKVVFDPGPGVCVCVCVGVCRMDEDCTPKELLFSDLLRRRPFNGVKKRWRDEVAGNLRTIGVGDGWFQ